jgi:hypothetical protein
MNTYASETRVDDFSADIHSTLLKYADLRAEVLAFQLAFGGPFIVKEIKLQGENSDCYTKYTITLQNMHNSQTPKLENSKGSCVK